MDNQRKIDPASMGAESGGNTETTHNKFNTNGNVNQKKGFDLSVFAVNGKSQDMKKRMLDDKHVLGKLALLGQSTVFYAAPNTGKTLITLHLLIESITKKVINPNDVFYINADDTYKGLTEKLELAEQHNFLMLAPNENGFKVESFLGYLQQMIKDDTAKGKIIILDTLKKFTDPMDKGAASQFGFIVRHFVTKGGTIIMLAHVNKHKTADNKPMYGGTSDIVDDADCAYTMDITSSDNGSSTIIFDNIKSRGFVEKQATYTFNNACHGYKEKLESVTAIDEKAAKDARLRFKNEQRVKENQDIIIVILNLIHQGVNTKTKLIEKAVEQTGFSSSKIKRVIELHEGRSPASGHQWYVVRGTRNTCIYTAHTKVNIFE